MSHTHAYPSLHARIREVRVGQTTIPAGESWTRPPVIASYTERYRGTEYESHLEAPAPDREPFVSLGRQFVLLSGVVAATVTALALSVTLS